MPFHGHNKLFSLWALPIIFLAQGPQKNQPPFDPQLLWGGGITICLLLSGASLGFALIETRKLKKNIRESISTLSFRFDKYKKNIDSVVADRLRLSEAEVNTLKAEIKSKDDYIRALDLKIDNLNKQLSALTLQAQNPISARPSTQPVTEASKTEPSVALLYSAPQSVKSMTRLPVQSQPGMPMGSDQAAIGWETNKTANSKLDDFAAAIETSNGSIIRDKTESELNITKESEDALVRREAGHKTQLEEVNGGGSYHRLSDGDRHWLFPTPLTLKTIARYQPSKGLFQYEVEPVTTPRIKQPAEIRLASSSRWEVIELGTIIVPE